MLNAAPSSSPLTTALPTIPTPTHAQLPAVTAAGLFNPTAFICAAAPVPTPTATPTAPPAQSAVGDFMNPQALTPEGATAQAALTTTQFLSPQNHPHNITLTAHLPPGTTHVIPTVPTVTTEPLIPSPISRSLASLYAPPVTVPQLAPPPIPVPTTLPQPHIAFPAADPSIIESLQNMLLAAAATGPNRDNPLFTDLTKQNNSSTATTTTTTTGTPIVSPEEFLHKFHVQMLSAAAASGQGISISGISMTNNCSSSTLSVSPKKPLLRSLTLPPTETPLPDFFNNNNTQTSHHLRAWV